MAKFFSKNQVGERAKHTNTYTTARNNLLLVIVLSLVNIFLAATGSETYFLFTASIPHFIVVFGAIICGKYPLDVYESMGIDTQGATFLSDGVFAGIIAIAVVIVVLYFLFWLFSKKHVGWLIAALVLFSIDTVFMFVAYEISSDMIINLVFHALVFVYLIMGIVAHYKLKALPEDAPASVDDARFDLPDENNLWGEASTNTESSPALRRANTEDKSRTFVEAEAFGHKITYRRIKRVNELVIDGYVYADVEMLIEASHELEATLDGHTISAGLNGVQMYIKVDGETVAKKIRFY